MIACLRDADGAHMHTSRFSAAAASTQWHWQLRPQRSLLHFSVGKEIRLMWAALTSGMEGSPADNYPDDINLDWRRRRI
jgi:hypothetical protein